MVTLNKFQITSINFKNEHFSATKFCGQHHLHKGYTNHKNWKNTKKPEKIKQKEARTNTQKNFWKVQIFLSTYFLVQSYAKIHTNVNINIIN